MPDVNYDDVLQRIQGVYSSCSALEQKQLLSILQEMSSTGYSATLEQLWLADFKEVPVSIDQFIADPRYLGTTNRNGDAVYPFWKQTLHNLFGSGNQYNEIVLSGATRIGKTSTAVIITSYMLYRLMLYRNPHEYFKKKQVSKFTIAFANLTKDLAEGVAFREFNDTLKESEWFNDHGSFSRSERKFYYIPEGDKIDIIAGSDSAHMLGMQLWCCLTGNTKVLTSDGYCTLEDAVNTYKTIMQIDNEGQLIECNAPILLTKHVTDTIRITLEDDSVIEGTPDHRVMLTDGSYKQLVELTEDDDILTFNIHEVDEMNLKSYDSKFLVYMHTSPNGKRYVGITSKSCQERWGKDGIGYKANAHFYHAICKYGWSNFAHEIIASDLSLSDACKLEEELIAQYNTMNQDKGYNHTTGGNWSSPDEETRHKISARLIEVKSSPDHRKKMSDAARGHIVSESTKAKISAANKGRLTGKPAWNAGMHMDDTFREKVSGHSSWCKGLTKETDDRLRAISMKSKGRKMSAESKKKLSDTQKRRYAEGFNVKWINNGNIETCIPVNSEIPSGFVKGRLNILDTYVNLNGTMKKIASTELQHYLDSGWVLGRGKDVGQAIRSKIQKYYWVYNNCKFNSATELAIYLNVNGYPKIVGSTITSLFNTGFDKSIKYSSLSDKIQRVEVGHEDK